MMLLERDLIQSVGFRNVTDGGRVTGFQFRVRMPSYRGMAASLIDGIAVRVGGIVDVGPDVPLWTFGGRTYTLQQLWDSDGVRWPLEEAAVVTVPSTAACRRASTSSPSSCGCGCPTYQSSTSPPLTGPAAR